MMPDEIEVSYTVKELLADLNRKLDGFMSLLASKADVSSVTHAHDRIDKVEEDVTTLRHSLAANEKHAAAKREFRRWVIPAVISAATVVVLILQVFHG